MNRFMLRFSKLLVLVGAISSIGAYRGCVFEPLEKDFITTNASINLQGTISEFNADGKWLKNYPGEVRLKKNDIYITNWQATDGTVWKVENVAIQNGINTIEGDVRFKNASNTWVNSTIPEFLVEKKTDLTSQGVQKVFFDYSAANIDEQIKSMGENTLNHTFTAAELDQFVVDVKAKIRSIFISAYNGTNIQLVNAAGTDIHTIKFSGNTRCDYYGESPLDYKNLTKAQTSNIYLGTFKCIVVDDNRLLNSTAATKDDSIAQRVADIGTFIGRTVVHELGHSLGLTDEGNLHGCEGTHNCEGYDASNPSDRFDDGHYMMDPGPKSTIWARIGQANSSTRKAQVPRFNSYNKSYLGIIH